MKKRPDYLAQRWVPQVVESRAHRGRRSSLGRRRRSAQSVPVHVAGRLSPQRDPVAFIPTSPWSPRGPRVPRRSTTARAAPAQTQANFFIAHTRTSTKFITLHIIQILFRDYGRLDCSTTKKFNSQIYKIHFM